MEFCERELRKDGLQRRKEVGEERDGRIDIFWIALSKTLVAIASKGKEQQ